MRKIKTHVSILLSLMMVIGMFTVIPFTASAEGTVTADIFVDTWDKLHTDTEPQCLTVTIKKKYFTGHSLSLNDSFTVKVNGTGTVTYSPLTYCYRAQSSANAKLANVAKAVYNYWVAADKFFA